MADRPKSYFGLLGEFETPAETMTAASKVRDAGFEHWDVYSPYPVHGMDDAMGLKNSNVGWFTFIGGLTGVTTGMVMIWFMNAFDYAIPVGGKPLFSGFAAFPVSYELTILLGAFGTLFGMLFLNRLPRLHHPLLKNERFKKVTHDKFFIVIECRDASFNEQKARELLTELGSKHIEMVEE